MLSTCGDLFQQWVGMVAAESFTQPYGTFVLEALYQLGQEVTDKQTPGFTMDDIQGWIHTAKDERGFDYPISLLSKYSDYLVKQGQIGVTTRKMRLYKLSKDIPTCPMAERIFEAIRFLDENQNHLPGHTLHAIRKHLGKEHNNSALICNYSLLRSLIEEEVEAGTVRAEEQCVKFYKRRESGPSRRTPDFKAKAVKNMQIDLRGSRLVVLRYCMNAYDTLSMCRRLCTANRCEHQNY